MGRKKHAEEELPFVALMDTMTNVVGVLIIVLVMVGIGLAKSVNKVLSDLPPVSVEEHAKLKKQIEDTKPKEDPKKVEEELAKLKKELTKATDDLKTLDLTKDKQNIKVVDLDALKKQLEERQKERNAKKEALDKLLAEIDKLKKQLDTIPVYQPPPSTIVKLPNPRPMPDKAVLNRFLVAGGRVLFIDDEQFANLVEEELKKNEATLAKTRETLKGPDGKPLTVKDKFGRISPQRKVVYDPKKVADYFAKFRTPSRDLKLDVIPAPTSPRIPVKLTPLPNSGETVEQAKELRSVFQAVIKRLKTDPKGVIWFHVFKDSFETYFAIRDIADQAGIPVGWDLYGNAFFTRALPSQFVVDYIPAPPPPPGATPAIVIAPPKTTLD